MVKNELKNLIKQGYKVLAEDASTLEFKPINININKEVEKYAIYEIDHTHKVVYLEAVNPTSYILIASNDALQLPLYAAKNYNEAAAFLKVEATHIYRAWRNAGRPAKLVYKDYILIKM